MRKPNGRELKALIVLSIVAPVSILISLRLTGILQEPTTISETITLEAVKWEFERPNLDVNIWDRVENPYSDDDVSIVYGILVDDHDEKSMEYQSSDYVAITVNVTAAVQEGFVESVYVVFREDYELSVVNPLNEPYCQLENLTIKDWADGFYERWKLENNTKAFIEAVGVNKPSNVHFWAPVEWVLRSLNNQLHQMEIIFEFTYFNGAVYKRVVQPFQLKIAPDDNDSFETADEIKPGTYKAYVDSLDDYDPVDYYKVWLDQGQIVEAELAYPPHQLRYIENPEGYYPIALDMYIYDPNRELKACLIYEENETRQITFTADSTGYWYIRINHIASHRIYLLDLSIHPTEGG